MVALETLRRRAALPRSAVSMRRLSLVLVVVMWVNIASGALVRVTGSGLGCPNWPTCSGARPIPAVDQHAIIEFSNRLVAFGGIVVAVAAWMAARRLAVRLHRLRRIEVHVEGGRLEREDRASVHMRAAVQLRESDEARPS